MVLEAGGIWFEVELMAGGGGRPGMDLIGGGRSGRNFALEGLEKEQDIDFQQKRNRRWSSGGNRASGFCLWRPLTMDTGKRAFQQLII